MKRLINRISNSEFLTFNEVLRLKLAIVTFFLAVFVILSFIASPFSNATINESIFIPMGFLFGIVLTIIFMVINLNRLAMHLSIFSIVGLTIYFVNTSNYFYGFIMFFVSLIVIIFYQDIITYLLYGSIVTAYGIYYIVNNSEHIIGTMSINADISELTYLVVLIGFYVVFLIQFLVSDNIYEKMNNEWVRMNKILVRYQESIFKHLEEIHENEEKEAIYNDRKFQQTVSEISIFINEFFEDEGDNIAEVVEYYFFLHSQDVGEIIQNDEASLTARRYASQLQKYLLSYDSELQSMIYDFSTLFKKTPDYSSNRYEYNLDTLFDDRIDKFLSLAILYKFLHTETTQIDKYGNVKRVLSHEEITKLFISKEFREFLSFEQVNFYLDNQELFELYL